MSLSKLVARFDYIHGPIQRYMGIPRLLKQIVRYRNHPLRLFFLEGFTARFTAVDVLVFRILSLLGWKILFDIHDIPPDQYYLFTLDSDSSNKPLPMNKLRARHSTILDFAAHEFERSYHQNQLIILLNASNPNHFRESSVPKQPTVFYVGGFSEQLGTSLLLSAMYKVREQVPEANLVLVGSPLPSYREEFNKKIAKMPFVRVYPKINYFKIPEIIERVRVCVLPYLHNVYLNLCNPVKLFDYMAAGRPIVTTRSRIISHIVEDAECGIVTGFDSDTFAQGLVQVLKDDKLANRLGKNGRVAALTKHSWDIRARQLLDQARSYFYASER
jgi:glycosyltransferase involved in cell wall biosynthesis